ncbi:hypothetical protein PC41400_14715 [Paenibacillus chitinolyticus]|uniref:Uncharacterized protein n=1 Tax=Paenibacillus chitinolyticus TaxID=79263 RepID=A0A410WX54_9BACL|nr:hypothetical protein [Paenibacillus chitinolyticus]MCY9593975.1 hypothetical protein [Paenibacillus chitinolyticus]MCY9599630.1 hypothetical protein [Paenibacillus chitinolyticus]QAV18862.1 hypothetical protein PC41400_14715 [Paenibacillus chitinolyticus]
MIKRRFLEYEYFKNLLVKQNDGLTEEEAVKVLNEKDLIWGDLTFTFKQQGNGWRTDIYCNNSDTYITPRELNPVEEKWFLDQVTELSMQKYLALQTA